MSPKTVHSNVFPFQNFLPHLFHLSFGNCFVCQGLGVTQLEPRVQNKNKRDNDP